MFAPPTVDISPSTKISLLYIDVKVYMVYIVITLAVGMVLIEEQRCISKTKISITNRRQQYLRLRHLPHILLYFAHFPSFLASCRIYAAPVDVYINSCSQQH